MTATLSAPVETPAAPGREPRSIRLGGVRLTFSWVALGLLALAVIAVFPQPWHQLRAHDPLVDLHVYKAAGDILNGNTHPDGTLVTGPGVYGFEVTQPVQQLPFTYPPTAAAVSYPLGWVPRDVLNLLWTLLTYLLLVPIVAKAFSPLLNRLGSRRAGMAVPVLWAGMAYLLPVRDVVHFGQVGIILLALVMTDVLVPGRRRPTGLLIALATAIKLTPGVFVVMYAAAGRWRLAFQTAALTVLVVAVTAVLIPQTSWTYWTSALFDNSRLGPNDGTSNQSIRGMLLHTGIPMHVQSILWLGLVLVVGGIGFTRAGRAFRNGDLMAATAITGLLAALLSPVAWIHHLTVIVLVIGVLLGEARSAKRVAAAVAVTALFATSMPWWGYHHLRHDSGLHHGHLSAWHPVWWAMQNSFGLAAVVLVLLVPYARAGARRTTTWVAENTVDQPSLVSSPA